MRSSGFRVVLAVSIPTQAMEGGLKPTASVANITVKDNVYRLTSEMVST